MVGEGDGNRSRAVEGGDYIKKKKKKKKKKGGYNNKVVIHWSKKNPLGKWLSFLNEKLSATQAKEIKSSFLYSIFFIC